MKTIFYEGERIPFGWGFVYYDYERDGVEYLPMPLNWLKQFVFWLMRRSHRLLSDEEIKNHRRVQEAINKFEFTQGIERYNAGYEKGFAADWEGARREILRRIDEHKAEHE